MRLKIILLLLLIFIPMTVSAGWPEYLNDSRNTGYANADFDQDVANVWTYSPSGRLASSATVVNHTVYIGTMSRGGGGRLISINSSLNELRWYADLNGTLWSTPAYSDGTVYVGSLNGSLYAVNNKNGRLKWKYDTYHKVFSSPTIHNKSVYFGTRDSNAHKLSTVNNFSLYKLNTSDGSLQWSVDMDQGVFGSASVSNGSVYVGDQNGTMYAISERTGEVRWKFNSQNVPSAKDPMVRYGGFASTPSIYNDTIYTASYAGDVYALNASTGQMVWRFNPRKNGSISSAVVGSPAVANNKLYVGSYDGNLYAVDAFSGKEIWRFTTEPRLRISKSSPVISGGSVYVGTAGGRVGGVGGSMYEINATDGTQTWSIHTDEWILSSPAVTEDGVFFTNRNRLYLLN